MRAGRDVLQGKPSGWRRNRLSATAWPWDAALMRDQCTVRLVRGDLPDDLATAFMGARRVAWDVETSGLDWRLDRLGTCQIFAEDLGVVVVVSLSDGKPTALRRLLQEVDVEKIFHHAPFDLRFMVRNWDVRPMSIRCTKVASKLLEPSAPNEAHTLKQLVSRHLGVSLDKGDVRRSDWTSGSLTNEQLKYAAADVMHLPALLDALVARLHNANRASLYDACCAFLPARVTLELGEFPDVFAY